MKKEKIITYEYPFSKEHFLNDFKRGLKTFANEYEIKVINETLFVEVQKKGHSSTGGIWYFASLEEKEGKTIISGKTVIDPDENGVSMYKETTKEKIENVFLFIFTFTILLPIVLILFIIKLVGGSYYAISKKEKPLSEMNNKEKLDSIMINCFHCTKINNQK